MPPFISPRGMASHRAIRTWLSTADRLVTGLSALFQVRSRNLMDMKVAPALLIVVGLLWGGNALAAPDPPGKDHPNGVGKEAGMNNGSAPAKGAGGSATGASNVIGASVPPPAATSDQNGALKAVQSGAALPLNIIVELAQKQGAGRVIEARLVRNHGQLLYQLTMLSDDGVSRRAYYDARSGRPAAVR